MPGEGGGSILNQFSPALEGSTELLEVNRYSPPFSIGAAPSVDQIGCFRDPMLPRDVFSGPCQIPVFHLPTPIRQIPLVREAALIVWCASFQSFSARKTDNTARPEPARGSERRVSSPDVPRPTEEAKSRLLSSGNVTPRVFLLYQESSERSREWRIMSDRVQQTR